MGAECEGDQTEPNPHAVIRLQTRSGHFCGALFEEQFTGKTNTFYQFT